MQNWFGTMLFEWFRLANGQGLAMRITHLPSTGGIYCSFQLKEEGALPTAQTRRRYSVGPKGFDSIDHLNPAEEALAIMAELDGVKERAGRLTPVT